MALTTVTSGNTILSSDINQIIDILQRRTSQSETGAYYLAFNAYQTNAIGNLWVPSLSRNATPASSSIDQSIQAQVNCSGLSVANTSSSGLQINITATGATNNAHVAGVFVLNY